VTALRVGIVLVLAIAATVVANIVLLGVATGSSEPVGRLTPRAELIPVPTPAPQPPVPTTPTQTQPRVEPGERSDD
jgi:hypothetical protein